MSDARGDPRAFVRQHWRIIVLVLLLIAAAYFLFLPGAPITGAAASGGTNASAGPTNLQFGIDLAGGARITAPVEGLHATDVGVTEENDQEIVSAVATAMNVSAGDVQTSAQTPARNDDFVEVRGADNRTAFVEGLQAAGLDVQPGGVQQGVTSGTRQDIVGVLDARLGESGFSGGSVTAQPGRSPPQIRIESPGRDLDRLEEIATDQGEVRVLAHVPNESAEQGYTRHVLYRNDGIDQVLPPNTQAEGPGVSVRLTRPAAEQMTETMQATGFTDSEAWSNCSLGDDPGPGDWCLMTTIDGQVIFSGGIEPGLGQQFRDAAGDDPAPFLVDRTYRMQTQNGSQASELRLNLQAGALSAPLDMEQASTSFISPALAENFKINSLLVGLLAVLAVVVVVFLRYGDPEVAVPMSATALSEVVILLGFAAAIGWPLELSHVAGFITVIGTGVDDLVIIADEIEQQGRVNSQRVFQNRFRKAFWVIGAAAATTIVAMSPLAILNPGDLRGFAVVTILGVLIGIAISRPAYGSILRQLLTGDH